MSLLNQVSTKKKQKPLALLVYGVHGVGKTSLPMEAEAPVYVTSEENDEYDIARFPRVDSWDVFKAQLKTLREEKHDFQTLVIDTMDTFEQLAEKHILSKDNAKSMVLAYGGFGKAYDVMAEMFLDIRDNYLIPLRDKKGMQIVILCHSDQTKKEDPVTNTSYDRYVTALHKKVKPIFQDWVSAIFFINYDLVKLQRKGDGKEILEGIDGKRVIFTEERPSHDGKNRFDLPYEIPFDKTGTWDLLKCYVNAYYQHAETAKGKSPEKADSDKETIEIMKEIDRLAPQMPEELRAPISVTIEKALTKDESKRILELNRILKKMKSTIGEK